MNAVKKRKLKKWLHNKRLFIFGAGSFILIGLIGALIGFEIEQDWHAIRNWVTSPKAVTLLICSIVGAFFIGLMAFLLIVSRRGDED